MDQAEWEKVNLMNCFAMKRGAEGTLAIEMGARVEDIAATIHAHPTLAEILMEAAHKALDQGIHG